MILTDEERRAIWLATDVCGEDVNPERYAAAIEAAVIAKIKAQGAVARVVSSGPHDFPLLQWLSADHSFRAPIGSTLYTLPGDTP